MTLARKPAWQVLFEGSDFARDLAASYLSVTYTDHLSGKSDEIRVVLNNEHGFWTGPGYPTKGDLLKVQIGRIGEYLLPAGGFYLSEFEESGPPDTFELTGLAANILPAMRSAKTSAYEQVNISDIVGDIAAQHGLAFRAVQLPATVYSRITQNKESDLAFLKRLANERSLAIKVTDAEVFLAPMGMIEREPPVITLQKKDMNPRRFRDKVTNIFKEAVINYTDAQTGENISYTASTSFSRGDTLKIAERVENTAHAQERTEAALRQTNQLLTTGSATVAGNPALQAGNSVQVEDIGQLSGKYLITKSTHSIQRTGPYKTALELRLV